MSRKSKVSDEELKKAVEKSKSILETLRNLGLKEAGGTHSYYSKRVKKLCINTDHFYKGSWNKGKKSTTHKSATEILKLRTEGGRTRTYQLVRALLESGVAYLCAECGQPPAWMGNPLVLDVDHIDQNWLDDRLHNLRFLCPNCHSQFSRKLRSE